MSNSVRSIDQYLLKISNLIVNITTSPFPRNVKISGERVGYAVDIFSGITINCKLYYFWWQLLTLDSYGLWRSTQATRVTHLSHQYIAAAIKVATNTFSSQLTAIFCRCYPIIVSVWTNLVCTQELFLYLYDANIKLLRTVQYAQLHSTFLSRASASCSTISLFVVGHLDITGITRFSTKSGTVVKIDPYAIHMLYHVDSLYRSRSAM